LTYALLPSGNVINLVVESYSITVPQLRHKFGLLNLYLHISY